MDGDREDRLYGTRIHSTTDTHMHRQRLYRTLSNNAHCIQHNVSHH